MPSSRFPRPIIFSAFCARKRKQKWLTMAGWWAMPAGFSARPAAGSLSFFATALRLVRARERLNDDLAGGQRLFRRESTGDRGCGDGRARNLDDHEALAHLLADHTGIDFYLYCCVLSGGTLFRCPVAGF